MSSAEQTPPHETLWKATLASLLQRRFICKYFAQLDAEFAVLCEPQYAADMADRVAGLRARHAARPSWQINHQFENLIALGLRAPIIKQRSVVYRERLLALAGITADAPLARAFDLAPEDDIETQRARLLGTLSEVQRLRHVRSEFERLRNRLFLVCMVCGLCFVGFFLSLYLLDASSPFFHQAGVQVTAAGLLGGYFSVLLRFGGLRWCLDYNANYHQVDRLFWNIAVSFALSLFEGAVGAYLLYTLFLAGAVQGSLFPDFGDALKHLHSFGGNAQPSIKELLGTLPSSPTDTAKLLVWSVLAGFSERLVPDIFTALAQQRTASRVSATAPSAS